MCVLLSRKDYVDGEASAEEISLVQAHLKTCERCQSHLAFLKMLGPAINSAPVAAPSPLLFDRIAKATYARPTWQQKYLGWLAPLPLRWTVGSGLVTAAVVAVLVAPRVMQITPETPDTDRVAVNKAVPTPSPAEGTVKPAPAPTIPDAMRPATTPATPAPIAAKPVEPSAGTHPEPVVTPKVSAARVAIAPKATVAVKPKVPVKPVTKTAEPARMANNHATPKPNPAPPLVEKPAPLPTPPPKTTESEPIVIASAPDRETSVSSPSATVSKPITIAANVKPEVPAFTASANPDPGPARGRGRFSIGPDALKGSNLPPEMGDVSVRKTLAVNGGIVPIADSPVK